MNINKQFQIRIIAFFMLAIVTGCATTQTAVYDPNMPKVETSSAKSIEISSASIQREDNMYVIKGAIKRKHFSRTLVQGHIDVTLMDAEGKVLKEVCTSSSPRLVSKSHVSSNFTARVDPEGYPVDHVAVRYHSHF